uniref:START domain-containing protein n=1 Tax=Heterorhabditis bacteriophora TaxID=37862 RepID=A0A1I7WU95_HETBA
MSATVELLGVQDETTDSQYASGLRNTAAAFVEALKIYDDARRADRKDWKMKSEHKGDKCFNKHFPVGKVYYLKKEFSLDMETLFRHHWDEIEKTHEWNPNVQSVNRVATISEHADILHYYNNCRFFFSMLKRFNVNMCNHEFVIYSSHITDT